MSGAEREVVVKNTFLEIGEHQSLLERSDVWRRQVSEPVKIYTSGKSAADNNDALSDCESPEEEFEEQDAEEEELGGVSNAAGNKPPKLLLLSESIPFQQKHEKPAEAERLHQAYPQRGQVEREAIPEEREKKEPPAREGTYINHLKDNDITKKEPPWVEVTTVMMRNLPNKYTQQMLLEELQDAGFRLQADFDFFYLPMDHSNAANLGYCFINFNETGMANAFAAAFQGKKMRRFNSNKTVVVMPASIQGFERNYAYYASTRVAQAEDPQYRPLFMRPPPIGQPAVPMTASTKLPTNKIKGQAKSAGTPNVKGKKGSQQGRPDGRADAGLEQMFLGAGGYDNGGSSGRNGYNNGRPRGAAGRAAWVNPPVAPLPEPQQGRLTACWQCGTECSSVHRFCAFCGAFINQAGESSVMPQLRADAPTFVPGGGGDTAGPCRGRVARQQSMLLQQAMLGSQGTVSDMVTDELDVMRGRQMLLAALKEMEQREVPNPATSSMGHHNNPASLSNFTGLLLNDPAPVPRGSALDQTPFSLNL